jgi:uncharacterized membrane protein
LNFTNKQLNDNRLSLLDFIRGIAIALMFIYHLSFGLNEIGILNINMSSDYFWISFRAIIVFLFLTLVGIGLVLSCNKTTNKNKTYLESLLSKRLYLLFSYMMLITLFSYYVRPQYYVYFGILHLIFVSSLLGRLLLNLSSSYLSLIVLLFLIVGLNVNSAQLNHALVYWLGLGNNPPITDDFAPLFPWFSLVIFGLILGKFLSHSNKAKQKIGQWQANNGLSKLICWAGKYSIHLYFIHFQFFYFMVLIIGF